MDELAGLVAHRNKLATVSGETGECNLECGESVYASNVALYVLYTRLYTFGGEIGKKKLQNRPIHNDLRRIATV